MGGIEPIINADGGFQIKLIDQRHKAIDVGSKLSDFIVEKELGKGHFGSVSLVSSKKTKFLYAMKEIKASKYKTDKQRLLVEKEIKLLENLNHPNIISYFTSFVENDNFYIITEYINGGSLEDLLKKKLKKGKLIEEKEIFDLLIQSLSGLIYLHNTKKVIHRDIKPDNILIDYDGNVKISDFGLSAIDSEDANESVKCHGTRAGALDFMAPEMAAGEGYDFKSDIYMLGLTFFFIMSGRLPEKKFEFGPLIFTVKNPKAEIPDIYSEDIRNFIKKLLKPREERPTAEQAYNEATYLYLLKYAKITSICSSLQCFLSFPFVRSYFKGSRIQSYVDNDDKNETKKYLATKTFKNALFDIEPKNFNSDIIRVECLSLRMILFNNKERFETRTEIAISSFVSKLLVKLHNELNKYVNNNNNIPGSNNINNEENIENKETMDETINDNNETIDEANAESVITATMKQFMNYFKSKISDDFFYLDKSSFECSKCQRIFKYTSSIICLNAFFPYRATLYLNKQDIDVIDLFKHYRKKRLFKAEGGKINCKFCGQEISEFYKTKIMYTSPNNLIINLSNEKSEKYKLTINKSIDISDFVERKDFVKTKYDLVGAIFYEDKKNIYISISKNENGEYFYCDSSSVKKSSFNELVNHNNARMLFYASC
jgi:mitogen-activated protein kinase kinase 1